MHGSLYATALAVALVHTPARAFQITIHEPGWTIVRDVPSPDGSELRGVAFDQFDGAVYFASDAPAGLRRLSASNELTSIAFAPGITIADLTRVAISPLDGAVFVSKALNAGRIYRAPLNGVLDAWVTTWTPSGDTDFVGLAISDGVLWSGTLAAGTALVCDSGTAGIPNPDRVWSWSAITPGAGTVFTPDPSPGDEQFRDVVLTPTSAYVIDGGGSGVGALYELGASGALTVIATAHVFQNPRSIEWDPRANALIVADGADGTAWRVDPSTGACTLFLDGMGTSRRGQVDVSAGGRRIVFTNPSTNHVVELMRCTDAPAPDCDGDGTWDACQLELGLLADCNDNGVPDACDIAQHTSADANLDGMPDDCETGNSSCPGDGSVLACPCGNDSASGVGRGCANSVMSSGALLVATGSTQPDELLLVASGMPSIASASSIFLQGDVHNPAGAVFGDGVLCLGGSLVRLGARSLPSGTSSYPGVGGVPVSTRGGVIPGSGSVREYQTYYRNAAASFCPPATFNVTSGRILVW